MTNEQINIAIAKACGWEELEPWLNGDRCFELAGSTYGYRLEDIPDYCNDLNAMHEAEKVFTYEEAEQFEGELCHICGSENLHKEYPLPFEFSVAHASAAQRAEAFLKTIGKWEGAKEL